MPNILDANGLQTATQAELLAIFLTAYQTIYGINISIGSDTPDGQMINIFIQTILDVENLLSQIYSTFDPNNAIGVTLDQRVAINGIQRQAGTYTITNVTIVTSQSVNLYGLDQSENPVYTLSDAAGNQWELIQTQLGVSVGTNVFAFQSANVGAIISVPNTITVPVTIVLGVSSVNNPTTYTTLGLDEENDAALKLRRSISTSLSSQGYLAGLRAALLNINGVVSVNIEENDSSSTNGDGVPGHSIWVIVDGTPAPALAPTYNVTTTYPYGQLASSGGINYISWQNNNTNNSVTNTTFWGVYNSIAQTIYAKRNAGCGMYGATQYTITQVDGTPFVVTWDGVIAENLFILFTANSLDGIHAPNIAGIVAGLPAIYMPGVYAEVNINQLGTLVQQIDSNTMITGPGFSTSAGGSYTNTLTPTTKNYQFVVSSADIIVLPMIMSAPIATAVIVSGLVTNTVATIEHGGNTIQFKGLGGYGTLTYSMVSGAGSINSSSGLYTSSSSGTDVVEVTDSLSNTTTCTITVT